MKQKLIVTALATVLMMAVLRWQGAPLQTTLNPRGIVDLELATQSRQVVALMDIWDHTTVHVNIWIDFLFIVSYVAFLAIASEAVANKWKHQGMKMLGLTLARIALVIGLLDISENLLMLQTIDGNYTVFSLQITHYLAATKFTLAATILLYLLISIPNTIRNYK